MTDRSNPPHKTVVQVSIEGRSYDILIGEGLLASESSFEGLPPSSDAMIVSNRTVAPLHASALRAQLSKRYARVHMVELPDGETHKDWRTLNLIFDGLLSAQCDRRTVLYALGGGVVGDITGFAAACYMRGVPFVQIPTTLLAQVDSSVGGKTAINHPLGKNMIGAFYQPLRVIADLSTLRTLPRREVAAGLAEVIKYGPIADPDFFDWIEKHIDDLLVLETSALTHAVMRSCEIKAEVVVQDEREAGLRAILNFGHTFGHAIEAGLGFGEWLHGEAVGCGMVIASVLSQRLGYIDEAYTQRIRQLVQRAGLPVRAPDFGRDRWMELMRVDKKAEGGKIRYVLLERPGRAVVRPVPDDDVAAAIDACVR